LKAQTIGWVSLSCGRSRSRIATISAESFPELPKLPREGASFSTGVLARLIEKAAVAVSSESVNTTVAGALLKIDNSIVHPVNVIAPRINDLPEHQQKRYLEVTDVTREYAACRCLSGL